MSDPVEHSQNLRIRALELRSAGVGPPGPQGPPGPTGPTGPPGQGLGSFWSPYDSPAFGSYPADLTTLRVRPFYHYGVSDQYGIVYIPTGFTQCFAACVATPTEDVETVHLANWIKRVSSLGTAGIWCYRVSGGTLQGCPNQGCTVAGIMVGL